MAFASVATLALPAPAIGALAAVPFALIVVIGRTVAEGDVVELAAPPGDDSTDGLRGLVGFALVAMVLALVAALSWLPVAVFVTAVIVLGYGILVEQLLCSATTPSIRRVAAFVAGGAIAATIGLVASTAVGGASIGVSMAAFLGLTGGLAAAVLRTALVEDDDPIVLVAVAGFLWPFAGLGIPLPAGELALAIGIAGGFGYLSWVLGTASITGMLTGIIISLAIIVFGGYGWFAVLIAFFGLGGLAAKYRFEEKLADGVAEGTDGARGGRNVLGNAAVALLAVLGFAGGADLGVDPTLFLFAFVGSVSTAMSDTLSSEIGVLFDDPRLITTFEPVETGTDGGITLQGSLAGLVGAVIVAAIAILVLDVGLTGGGTIVVAGVLGMFADSVLGALLEGRWIGNQTVNFLATLVGAAAGAIGAVGIGLAG